MSDQASLKLFSRQAVTLEMVSYLTSTTNAIIQVRVPKNPVDSEGDGHLKSMPSRTVPLSHFINRLIKYLNVQTPTLMATLIYLNRLRNLLPANAIGMETTRHRIFLAALILSAKSLNDSSPLNKHWTKYTDGLLTLSEVNLAERELLSLLRWDVNIKEDDLILVLQPFLQPLKVALSAKQQVENKQKVNFYKLSNTYKPTGHRSALSTASSSSIASDASRLSLRSSHSSLSINSGHMSNSNLSLLSEDSSQPKRTLRIPLSTKSVNINSEKHPDYKLYNNIADNINLSEEGRFVF